MKVPERLRKRIPDVKGVTARNADLVLFRVLVAVDEVKKKGQKASVGVLGHGQNGSQWPCVENVSWNWLRKGPYKIRMFKRNNNILQIAAPWWGQHLIHPTSAWQSLRGCIAVGDSFDFKTMRLVNSLTAHRELMNELGAFEEHKEFTLFVENNPEDKNPDAARDKWVAWKLRKKVRGLKKKR